MKAAAFLNLPMQTRVPGVVNLHAIDAEVVLLRNWIFCVDQRQCNEWSAVFLPRRQHRELIQTRGLLDHFDNWSARNSSRAELQKIPHQRSMFPQFRSIWGQERFGNADHLFDELLGLWAKSKINPLRSAKQIRNDRKAASLHSLKQQRRAALFNNAAMDFSKLEIRIDFSINRN